MRWRKVTLIGVGLLGGSLGSALKHYNLAESVFGFVRREASIRECLDKGAVDVATLDLEEAVSDAEIIVLCTPPSKMYELTERMLPSLAPGTIVTDVGSVKTSIVNNLHPLVNRGGCRFIGSHPMAGAEKTGVSNAAYDLFKNTSCIVTPLDNSSPDAVANLTALWESVGARVVLLSPETHDKLVGRCSHLPHILAAALSNYVLESDHINEQGLVCGNGFRDTTRIASGSPLMWRDIVTANKENILGILDAFMSELERFKRVLEHEYADAVEDYFAAAKQKRDTWCELKENLVSTRTGA
ncbi:MAG: prephenate dehydrogenase/arogenate dehydrogenase family protein [Verrucomicrobia bacterium]|nr:prephenate dehydrogenase/arogenate dehydrogenase family protein [Verrucomicrobiota bacterium]